MEKEGCDRGGNGWWYNWVCGIEEKLKLGLGFSGVCCCEINLFV